MMNIKMTLMLHDRGSNQCCPLFFGEFNQTFVRALKKIKIRILIFTKLYKLRNIYIFHKWINKLFSEENKVLWTPFEARVVAGSAKYKQSTSVKLCFFKFSLFIQSWKLRQFVYVVCLGMKKTTFSFLYFLAFKSRPTLVLISLHTQILTHIGLCSLYTFHLHLGFIQIRNELDQLKVGANSSHHVHDTAINITSLKEM